MRCHFKLLFCAELTQRIVMPIRPDQRWFYPIDWLQLSAQIRFHRARSRCEHCQRPHLQLVLHLGDGTWWDKLDSIWRDGGGHRLRRRREPLLDRLRATYVVLACAHLDHNPSNNVPRNLAALCQRCHMLHDAVEHRRTRWWNAFRSRALGDLFLGHYP